MMRRGLYYTLRRCMSTYYYCEQEGIFTKTISILHFLVPSTNQFFDQHPFFIFSCELLLVFLLHQCKKDTQGINSVLLTAEKVSFGHFEGLPVGARFARQKAPKMHHFGGKNIFK